MGTKERMRDEAMSDTEMRGRLEIVVTEMRSVRRDQDSRRMREPWTTEHTAAERERLNTRLALDADFRGWFTLGIAILTLVVAMLKK